MGHIKHRIFIPKIYRQEIFIVARDVPLSGHLGIKTKSGNEDMLMIMCSSSRFPEAIPLRSIKSKTT